MADQVVTPQRVNSNAPVHIGFSNDFKSCAIWTMVGLIGGIMLGIWLSKNTEV